MNYLLQLTCESYMYILREFPLEFSKIKMYISSMRIFFILSNREDPDEMPHYTAFQLGLHCLPK